MHRVAVDTSPLWVAPAGIARGIRGMFSAWDEHGSSGFQIDPFAWEVPNLEYRQPARMLKTLYREVFWAQCLAPGRLKKGGYDLLHSPGIPIIRTPIKGVKHVVTLNDLAPVRNPERFRKWHLMISRVGLKRALAADKVITISQFTADEAVRLIGMDPGKIEVVHLACDWEPDKPPVLEQPSVKIPERFNLFVGTLEPGKNLQLLKEVYQLAKSRGLDLPPLVVIGVRREGVAREEIAGIEDKFIYPGRIPDSQLAWFYSKAEALLFPSKYEGFGIPLIEAMTLGCPVICSRRASLGEIGGDAAVFTELNADDFLETMMRLSGDDTYRNQVIELGRSHSRNFTWKKTADNILNVYDSVLS